MVGRGGGVGSMVVVVHHPGCDGASAGLLICLGPRVADFAVQGLLIPLHFPIAAGCGGDGSATDGPPPPLLQPRNLLAGDRARCRSRRG